MDTAHRGGLNASGIRLEGIMQRFARRKCAEAIVVLTYAIRFIIRMPRTRRPVPVPVRVRREPPVN